MAKWLTVIATILAVSLAGCGPVPTPTAEPTAASSASEATVTVRELIDHTASFVDRGIKLSGKIVMECSQGCWFFLDDGTARIYVDLSAAGISIPQWVGKRVDVVGRIKGSGGNLQILGEEVKVLE